jgi:hypothetical protein
MPTVLFLLSACTGDLVLTPAAGRQSNFHSVDTTFKEFYQTLGGSDVLGPAISELEYREDIHCQFTESVLMCFNPAATDAGRFTLYPLGRELGIQEDLNLSGLTASPDARVVDGFVIYEKFLPLYDRMYGAQYVGRPLTELRINQDLNRVEQFFENAGFYQSLNDPNGPAYLIPYGAYLCGDCSYRLEEYWSIVKSNLTDQPFAPSMTRLGGPAVFGSLLLKPQIAGDGNLEQAYANAVFYASEDNPGLVRLRPLPLMLGYDVQPPVEMKSHEQLVFYEIVDGLGHNVPRPFDEFVALHGGRDLSGPPISEVVLVQGENLYQQCFENYCLFYDPAASESMKVRMAPLGKEYLQAFPPPEEAQIRNMFSPERISLVVSADKPNINVDEEQLIRMLITQGETGLPLERVEATLVLTSQDRPANRYFFPPTGPDGMAVLAIPPQPGLANGSRLSYQVCLNLPSEKPICALDSYLIWNVQQ